MQLRDVFLIKRERKGNKMKEKTIYDLDLHESLDIEEEISTVIGGAKTYSTRSEKLVRYSVLRVPGGWIYRYKDLTDDPAMVFVPFDNGFQKQTHNF